MDHVDLTFGRARNGTFHRVNTFSNELGYTSAHGGQTVYYLTQGKATAFKPGFRMTVGDPTFRTAQQLQAKYKYLDFTCLATRKRERILASVSLRYCRRTFNPGEVPQVPGA